MSPSKELTYGVNIFFLTEGTFLKIAHIKYHTRFIRA